ncbi:DUF3883 domain-containing protein [Desulfurivibrio sp. C05AmB]|uniref:DUF3883 domain-containing protein n=1 Tax=Desulfurivibrio sp. C05AmB TaxID=3374371 RepID=UPI00376EE6DC
MASGQGQSEVHDVQEDAGHVIRAISANQRSLYDSEPRELISHYNREKSALDGYRGRQVLELLQNADDAGIDLKDGCAVLLSLDRDRLVVANTGAPFTYDGLMSLVISDCSPKQLDRNRFIGCKGLGFRAVLTWTERPIIVSGYLRVCFDRPAATRYVESLANKGAQRVAEFHRSVGRWPVPVMRFPLVPAENDQDLLVARRFQEMGFTTVVVLPLPTGEPGDEVLSEAQQQLSELPTSAMLFCRHLVDVKIEGVVSRHWTLLREELDDESSRVIVSDGEADRYWNIHRRSAIVPPEVAAETTGGRQEYEIGIAVPESPDMPCDTNALCVFFPTRERLPCPLILHATLETTEDRNRIVDHASNRFVLAALAEHLASVLETEVQADDPHRPLQLLCGIENADHALDRLGFVEGVKQAVRARRLFPRLDGRTAMVDDVVLPPHEVWADVADVSWFPEMLVLPSSQRAADLVRWLGLSWLERVSLKSRLQKMVADAKPERVGTILGQLIDANQIRSIGINGLLLERQGCPIAEGEECFFMPTEELPPLPAWADGVKFLDAIFQRALLQASGHSSLRGLAGELERNSAKVSEYRFDTVARAVISRLNSDKELSEADRVMRWRNMLVWLLRASIGSGQVLPQLPINVVTAKGTLGRATSLYLSDRYPRGQIVARLYGPLHEDDFVASTEGLGLSEFDESEVEAFLIALGVRAMPKSVQLPAYGPSSTDYRDFREFVVDSLPFPISVRSTLCESPRDLRSNFSSYGISGLIAPDRLLRILKEGDPIAVMAYLMTEQQAVWASDFAENAYFQATIGRERDYRDDHAVPIPNPVLHWLREIAWVPGKDGKRHRPSEIMLSNTGLRILPSVYCRHAIDHKDELLASRGGKQAVDAILLRLGAVASLETMASEQVYDLLLSLPGRDPRGESVSAIYRTLLESNIAVEDGPNRSEFLRSGKVWAKHQGEGQFLPVAEVRYNANVTLPDEVVSRMALLDLPRRRNATAVSQLLNVKPLSSGEVALEVVHDVTEYDVRSEEANAFLRRCVPYIYALRLGKKLDDGFRERNLLKRTSLFVCSRLSVRVSIEGQEPETLVLDRTKDHICIESQLYVVGQYDPAGAGSTGFWLSVAGLIAEALGTDVAAEVGSVLRCQTEREMKEVVEVLLGHEASAKLDEARSRFEEWEAPEEDEDLVITPADPEDGQGDDQDSDDEEAGDDTTGESGPQEGTSEEEGDDEGQKESRFTETTPPYSKPKKKRRLVIKRSGDGGGGGHHGPVATEDMTFKIVEAFERQDGEGRAVINVSHIRGSDGFGCDLISVASEAVKEKALAAGKIAESEVVRFIEVKGRSLRTGDVELTDNEYEAAERLKGRYFLYRVFVDPSDSSVYEVAVLRDPVHSSARRTVTRFDLSKGSEAVWYALEEVTEE